MRGSCGVSCAARAQAAAFVAVSTTRAATAQQDDVSVQGKAIGDS
jgi:hypothetical protein